MDFGSIPDNETKKGTYGTLDENRGPGKLINTVEFKYQLLEKAKIKTATQAGQVGREIETISIRTSAPIDFNTNGRIILDDGTERRIDSVNFPDLDKISLSDLPPYLMSRKVIILE